MDEKLIKDGLYNLSPDSISTDHYARGLLVGMVTGIMATTGMHFGEALQLCKENFPEKVKTNCIPTGWK